MEIFKFSDNLCQLCQISSRPDIDNADIHICVQDTGKGLKLKHLIHEPTVGVVRCTGQTYMVFSSAAYPFQQVGVLRLCQILIRQHDAVPIIGQVLRL